MIYVVGASRSGTTMMSRIIGLNNSCLHMEEIHYFDEIATKYPSIVDRQEANIIFNELYKRYRFGYFSDNRKAENKFKGYEESIFKDDIYLDFLTYLCKLNNVSFAIDQTPINIMYMDKIAQIDEYAKFVVMVRDPREVLLSQKLKWKRRFLGAKEIPLSESVRSWLNYNPILLSKMWKKQYSQDFSKLKKVLVVNYEKLIEEPEDTIKDVSSLLEINYSDSMLNIPIKGSSSKNDDGAVGILGNNKKKWIHNLRKTEIAICEVICSAQLKKYSYKSSNVPRIYYFLGLTKYTMKLILTLPLLIALNKHRVKSFVKKYILNKSN